MSLNNFFVLLHYSLDIDPPAFGTEFNSKACKRVEFVNVFFSCFFFTKI